jgi:hypothetical protein
VDTRYFTPEEANEALAGVRPLAERMVEHRRALVEAERAFARIAEKIASNGGGLQPSELAAVRETMESEAAGLARCVQGIQELGGLVKDMDEGLVDFPARRGDEDVLLCWRVGENEIRYWHGTEEGFAGRKELPL